MIGRQLRTLLEPLRVRVSSMIARAVVRAVSDGHQRQELRVAIMGKDVAARVERFENYGLASYPYPGAGALLVFPQGNPDHPIALVVDDKAKRPQGLVEGEVRVWAAGGAKVSLKPDGTIRIEAPGKVEVVADQVEVSGAEDVTIDGADLVKIESAGAVEVDGTTQVKVSSAAEVLLESTPSSVSVTPTAVTITGPLVNIVQA